MTAIVGCSNEAPKNFIYHVSSSLSNPFRIGDVRDLCSLYFTKFPNQNKIGNPITVPKPNLISSRTAFDIHMTLRYVLPLKVCRIPNNEAKTIIIYFAIINVLRFHSN